MKIKQIFSVIQAEPHFNSQYEEGYSGKETLVKDMTKSVKVEGDGNLLPSSPVETIWMLEFFSLSLVSFSFYLPLLLPHGFLWVVSHSFLILLPSCSLLLIVPFIPTASFLSYFL